MTVAYIARADDGGLGTQAWEIVRHLRPEKVLVVDVQPRRGGWHLERYTDLGYADARDTLRVTSNPIPPADVVWLTRGMDTVIAPETFYLDDRVMRAGVGTRLALLVNPELFVPSYRRLADQGVIDVYAPTTWETDRLGRHTLLPQPVARDVIHHRHRTGLARTFLHVSSPAMLDRNGTDLVRDAVSRYDGLPITVLISGPRAPARELHIGDVTVRGVPPVANYYDLWNDFDVDVLLQPRRYGGLNMLQLEAAAAGVPTICLDREPERRWDSSFRVPVTGSTPHRMKGGTFAVYDTEPEAVADAMSWCSTLVGIDGVSAAADDWAESMAWHTLLPEWQQTFNGQE